MQEQDRNRLVAALSRLSVTFKRNLKETAINKYGQPITLVDIYEEALEGYNMEGIETACDNIINHQESPFFPVPGVIKKYYYDLPQPHYEELPEPEMTPEEKRRFDLTRKYTMRPFLAKDKKEEDRLRAEIKAAGPEGLEKYIRENWDKETA